MKRLHNDSYRNFQIDYDSIDVKVSDKEIDAVENDHDLIIRREKKLFCVYLEKTLLTSFEELCGAQKYINDFNISADLIHELLCAGNGLCK